MWQLEVGCFLMVVVTDILRAVNPCFIGPLFPFE